MILMPTFNIISVIINISVIISSGSGIATYDCLEYISIIIVNKKKNNKGL